MIYADQFIEVTFAINGTHVYGIGERYGPLMLDATADWQSFPLWSLGFAPQVSSFRTLVLSRQIYADIYKHVQTDMYIYNMYKLFDMHNIFHV